MEKASASFSKETNKTSIRHNNRDLTDKQKENDWHKHIDWSKSHENVYLDQTPLRDKFSEIFDGAVADYNAKQKRKDRRIDDYFQKVQDDKTLEPQREFIVQVGNIDDYRTENDKGEPTGNSEADVKRNKELANEILLEYYKSFKKRNPQLMIYNAVIHNDEASPHLHLNVIPVAEGYKQGMKRRPSFNKALREQGVKADENNNKSLWVNFRNQEVSALADLMRERGIERELVGTNAYKDHHAYKQAKQLEKDDLSVEIEQLQGQKGVLEKEIEALEVDKSTVAEEVNDKRAEVVKQAELQEWLKEKIEPLQEEVVALEAQKSAYEVFSSRMDDSPVRAQKRRFKAENGGSVERVVLPVEDFEQLEQKARYYDVAIAEKDEVLVENFDLEGENERLREDNQELRGKVTRTEKALELAEMRLKMVRTAVDKYLPDGKTKDLVAKAFDSADNWIEKQQRFQQQKGMER